MATTRPTPKPRPKIKPGQSGHPSRRSIGIALGVAIVAAGALVAVALLSRKDNTPAPVTTPVASFDGIPQSGRVLGFQNAKIDLLEFSDPQCPACRFYALDLFPTVVKEYVRTGKVKVEYHAFPFIGNDSVRGVRFILAAGLQNKLWQLHEALYRHQGAENAGWLTDDLVRQLAGQIPGLDVDQLFRDAQSAKIAAMINSDLRQVQANGINQTPSFLVKIGDAAPYPLTSLSLDVDSFRRALDDALRG
jgi:protein-disulfide isomerase